MLKKAGSDVLASLRGSTYETEYGFVASLASALPDGLFDHPVSSSDSNYDPVWSCFLGTRTGDSTA
jgi:hypothetical protein